MSMRSILVGLSGSEQSSIAAEVAWFLGKKLHASVHAEHIIESRSVWELLRSDTPGLIGSGPVVEVYTDVVDALRCLANKLALKYEAMAAGAGIESLCLIKEGNSVEILSRDAEEHDLIVVGHIPTSARILEVEINEYIRHSVAEGVSHHSKAPVLVVQGKLKEWMSMTIVSEIDHINFTYIRSCINLARMLDLKVQLEFWGTGSREETSESLKRDFFNEVPEAANLEVDVEIFAGHAVTSRKQLFQNIENESEQAALLPANTLFVLPTRGLGCERITAFGIRPEDFIRQLTLPHLLLWPEERSLFKPDEQLDQLISAK